MLLLALFAVQTPAPWTALWLAVPAAAGVSMLLGWRFGARAWLFPALLIAAAVAPGVTNLWSWWIPAAACTGVWMGMREEHRAPAGQRAWMLLPALALAAALPWALHYHDLIANVERELQLGDRQFLDFLREAGTKGDRLASIERAVGENAKLRVDVLPLVMPTILFLWVAVLVMAGRALASRLAGALRWPELSRASLREWRLPDGALWTFIAGLGLLVSPWSAWGPTAWTLLINSGLGFCVQGVAVVESLMLARGVPPSLILLSMVFVCTVAMPVFVLTTAALGLSDVWLDYRRLEAAPDGPAA